MDKKRRLNDATPEEWTASFHEVMRIEREKKQEQLKNLEQGFDTLIKIRNIEQGLNGTSYDDFNRNKQEWDDWKPNRDLG